MRRVLVRRHHIIGLEAELFRDAANQLLGLLDRGRGRHVFACDQLGIAPDRLAVLAPVQRERPARQAFAGVPLALAVVQQARRRVALAQAADQIVGALALGGADRGGVPLLGLVIVDRDEGRLAAERQPHVAGCQIGIDFLAQLVERGPGLVGERQRDARLLVDAGDLHLEGERHLGRIDAAGDRRGRAVMRRRADRQMALAAEQAGGRVEPDPAGAGQEDLGPGVQIGEVVIGAGRAVERHLVGLQLHQIAGHEAGGEAEPAQQLDQQPGRVPAGAGTIFQRFLGRLNAGLHADDVANIPLQPGVELDQEGHGVGGLPRYRGEIGLETGAGAFAFEIGDEVDRRFGRIGEGQGSRPMVRRRSRTG